MGNNRKFLKYLLQSECTDDATLMEAMEREEYYLNNLNKKVPSYYYAIYDELGILPDNNNIYDNYLNVLLNNFDINCNILEVGGGNLPRLGYRIARKQLDIGCGTITVMDSNLSISTSQYRNLKLCKSKFKIETDIDNIDLIIGLFPCDATTTIIKKALYENKDLLIRLCDCIHNKDNDYNYDEYHYYLTHLNVYHEMIISGYQELAKEYDRDIEVIEDETPYIMCKSKY